MRNITGPPAEGDDFWPRDAEVEDLRRELADGANLLLIAPRRVGKTSLVLRIRELARKDGDAAVFLNVEGCSDEVSFAEHLIEALRDEKIQPTVVARLGLIARGIRERFAGLAPAAGLDVDSGRDVDADEATLGRALESAFKKVEADGRRLLLVIDELPELLGALSGQDRGRERVAALLHWLRNLRQTYRQRTRWVFLGSIGLDTFVADRGLGQTINDLTPKTLGAIDPTDADRFLDRLGTDNGLPLADAVRARMLARVGWPLLHHLQILFHAMRTLRVAAPGVDDVDRAFETLLRPEATNYFDTWRQRLTAQLSPPELAAARAVLRFLCTRLDGSTRSRLVATIGALTPNDSTVVVAERAVRVLALLERDGYLLSQGSRLGFRSFLLREYWRRREGL